LQEIVKILQFLFFGALSMEEAVNRQVIEGDLSLSQTVLLIDEAAHAEYFAEA